MPPGGGDSRQDGGLVMHLCGRLMLLNPLCPVLAARILTLKATVVLLLTLLIKARLRIAAFSALGVLLLLLQTFILLAVSGGLTLLAGVAAFSISRQRRAAAL